jgi:hypothetical protein
MYKKLLLTNLQDMSVCSAQCLPCGRVLTAEHMQPPQDVAAYRGAYGATWLSVPHV